MPQISPLLFASLLAIAPASQATPQSASTSAADLEATWIQLDDCSFSEFFANANPAPERLQQLAPPFTLLNTGTWSIQNAFSSDDAFVDEQDRALAERQSTPDLDIDDEDILEDLYALKLEFNQENNPQTLQSSTQIGFQLSKNPLALSGTDTVPTLPPNSVPQPFSAADLQSQKNDIQIYVQQEVTIGERFNFFLLSELYPAIADPTFIPEWPTLDPQNQAVFNLEMEAAYQVTEAFSVYSYLNREDQEVLDLEVGLSYQLSDRFSLYGSVTRSLFPTDQTDVNGNLLQSAIDDTLKVGLSTALLDGNLEASVGVYTTFAQNVIIEADQNFEVAERSGQYIRQGIELSLFGEVLPAWSVEAIYTYSQTQQPEVAPHSAELITTYEIKQGRFEGWGMTSSLVWESSFLDVESFQSPYLRADTGVFYRGRGFRAYLGLENLFAVDQEPWAIVGTFIIVF